MKIHLKKPVDVPAHIQTFIDAVLSAKSLAEALNGFAWIYDKGDLCQWVTLLNAFDEFLGKQVKEHKSLKLRFDAPASDTTLKFPIADCLAILRVTAILLEHTSNKHIYQSYDHLGVLLASPHPEVVEAALLTLTSFLKKTHHASIRWHGNRDVNSRLMAMAQGWDTIDEGYDINSLVLEGGVKDIQKVTALRFEFLSVSPDGNESNPHKPVSISLSALHSIEKDEIQVLEELVTQYSVPEIYRFQLLCKIRSAKGCATLEGRRRLMRTRLLAMWIISSKASLHNDILQLFTKEAQLLQDLVTVVQTEVGVSADLRSLSLRVLASLVSDRSKGSEVVSVISTRGNGGFLSMLLNKIVVTSVKLGSEPSSSTAAGPAMTDMQLSPSVDSGSSASTDCYDMEFVESVLMLVSAMLGSSTGCAALTDAGVLGVLLPLLRDRNPAHVVLVSTTVKILENFLDYSQGASSTFHDLQGLHEMIQRLAYEAGVLATLNPDGAAAAPNTSAVEAGPQSSENAATNPQDPATVEVSDPMNVEAASSTATSLPTFSTAIPFRPMDSAPVLSALQKEVSAKYPVPTVPLPYPRKLLLKFLLRCIAISSYSPSNRNSGRPREEDSALLYACLKAMFEKSTIYGGSLFALAASVVTDLIHHDPLLYRELDQAGLPKAYVESVKAGVLPFGEAVTSIPNTLVALCLNVGGLEMVLKSRVLDSLIPIFTTKRYQRALGSETSAIVGASLEELFRFVPQLRAPGVEAVVDIFRTICIVGGDEEEIAKAKLQISLQEEADKAKACQPSAVKSEVGTSQISSDLPWTLMDVEPSDAAGASAPASSAPDPAVECTDVPTIVDEALLPSADVEMTPVEIGTSVVEATDQAVETPHPVPEPEPAEPRLPYDLGPALASIMSAEAQSYLPDSIGFTTRMLETLLSHNETAKEFVDRGGLQLLLKLHYLPRLSYTFAFSSASHPLLSVFRSLAPQHAQLLAIKMKDVLSEQLERSLTFVQAMGPDVCVPELEEEKRTAYLKVVSTISGLCSLGSSVARNTTHMLHIIATGPKPVLAEMGQLQRYFMQQAAVADRWNMAKEMERKATLKAGGSDVPVPVLSGTNGLGGMEIIEVETNGADMEGALDAVMGNMGEAEAPMVVSATDMDRPVTASGSALPIHPKPIKKKSPEEISHDIMHHSVSMLRGFFVAVAKSIHTPARRRDDPSMANPAQPGLGAKACALSLAVLLKGVCDLVLPRTAVNLDSSQQQHLLPAAADVMSVDSGAAAASAEVAVISSPKPLSNYHLVRLAEEAVAMLFDSRRRSCHVLILNFFVALGGLDSLLLAFKRATDGLWASVELKEAKAGAGKETADSATAATGEEAPSADASNTPAVDAPAGLTGVVNPAAHSAATTAAAAAQEHQAGSSKDREREPGAVAERAVSSFLSVLDQLVHVTAICASPQAPYLLATPLPARSGAAAQAQIRDPVDLLRYIQGRVMSVALEMWSHPLLPAAGPALTASLVTVLGHCAEGVGPASLTLLRAHADRGDGAEAGRRVASAAGAGFRPDPALIQSIVDMGFTQAHVELALRRIGANSIEAAIEWLMMHPEPTVPSPPAPGTTATAAATAATTSGATPTGTPAVVDEEEELSRALAVALRAVGISTANAVECTSVMEDASTAEKKIEIVSPVSGGSHTGMEDTGLHGVTEEPDTMQLVEGAVSILKSMPSSIFSMSDLVYTLATKEDAKDRNIVLGALIEKLRLPIESSTRGEQEQELYVASRLLLMLLTRDNAAREMASTLGLTTKLVSLLQEWICQYEQIAAQVGKPQIAAEDCDDGMKEKAAKEHQLLQVPLWVEVGMLILSCLAITKPKPKLQSAAAADPSASSAAAAAAAAAAGLPPDVFFESGGPEPTIRALMDGTGIIPSTSGTTEQHLPAAEQANLADSAMPLENADVTPHNNAEPVLGDAPSTVDVDQLPTTTQMSGSTTVPGASEATPAPAAAPAGTSSVPNMISSTGNLLPQAKSLTPSGLESMMEAAMAVWHPTGLITQQQADNCFYFCMRLLDILNAHAEAWCPPLIEQLTTSTSSITPSPSATAQTLLQLLARIVKRQELACLMLQHSRLEKVMSLPRACMMPNFARAETAIVSIILSVLEDPSTLETWMEMELRTFLGSQSRGARYSSTALDPYQGSAPLGTLLSSLSRVMAKEPKVFVAMVARVCEIDDSGNVKLKGPASKTVAADSTTSHIHPIDPTTAPEEGLNTLVSSGNASPAPAPAGAGAGAGDISSCPTPSVLSGDGAVPSTAVAMHAAASASASGAAPPSKSSSKQPKKPVSSSFAEVMTRLVDVVLSLPKAEDKQESGMTSAGAESAKAVSTQTQLPSSGKDSKPVAESAAGPEDMELDTGSNASGQQDRRAAGASVDQSAAPAPASAPSSSVDLMGEQLSQLKPILMSQVIALKALSEVCLIHSAAVLLLLRKDSEPSGIKCKGVPLTAPTPGHATSAVAKRHASKTPHALTPAAVSATATTAAATEQSTHIHHRAGALIKHLLHIHLTSSSHPLLPSLSSRASHLLQALCVKSTEARKRVINEVVATLMLGSGEQLAPPPSVGQKSVKSNVPSCTIQLTEAEVELALKPVEGKAGSTGGAIGPKEGCAHPAKVRMFIALLTTLLFPVPNNASLPPSRQTSNTPAVQQLISETTRTMRELGAARALATVLQRIQLDHILAVSTSNAVLSPLEVLTRNMANWAGSGKPAAAKQPAAEAGGMEGLQIPGLEMELRRSRDEAVPMTSMDVSPRSLQALREASMTTNDAVQPVGGGTQSGHMRQLLQDLDMFQHMGTRDVSGDMHTDDVIGGSSDDNDDEHMSEGGDDDDDDVDDSEGEGGEDDDDDEDGPVDGGSPALEEALEVQLPGGQVLHVISGDIEDRDDDEDDDMSDSEDEPLVGGSQGDGEEGDVGDIRSSEEGDEEEEEDGMSGSEEEDGREEVENEEDGGLPSIIDDDRRPQHLVDLMNAGNVRSMWPTGEEADQDHALMGAADMFREMMDEDHEHDARRRMPRMRPGGHEEDLEEDDDDGSDEEGDEEDSGDGYGDGEGDGLGRGDALEEQAVFLGGDMDADMLEDSMNLDAGWVDLTRRSGFGGSQIADWSGRMRSGLSNLLADSGDLHMVGEGGNDARVNTQHTVQMIEAALIRTGMGGLGASVGMDGGAAGNSDRQTAVTGDALAAAEEGAALLALASSNHVPQQHRMLERPPASAMAAGTAGSTGSGSTQFPNLRALRSARPGDIVFDGHIGNVHVTAIMNERGINPRSVPLNLPLPTSGGFNPAASAALSQLRNSSVRNGVELQAPPDSFPSIFAPPSSGGLGYRGGVSMGGGLSRLPQPLIPLGGRGGRAGELLHRLMGNEGRGDGSGRERAGGWGYGPEFVVPSSAGGSGEDVQFDARQLESQMLTMLRALQPQLSVAAPSAPAQVPAAAADTSAPVAPSEAGGSGPGHAAPMDTSPLPGPEPTLEGAATAPASLQTPHLHNTSRAAPGASGLASALQAALQATTMTPVVPSAAPHVAPPGAPSRLQRPDSTASALAAALASALTPTTSILSSGWAPNRVLDGSALEGGISMSPPFVQASQPDAGAASLTMEATLQEPDAAAVAVPMETDDEPAAAAAVSQHPPSTPSAPSAPDQSQEAPTLAQSAPADHALTMDDRLRRAAQAAGIDMTFLEALPEELRAEVLAMHGYEAPEVEAEPPAVPTAAPAVMHGAIEDVGGAAVAAMVQGVSGMEAAAPSETIVASVATATAAGSEEVEEAEEEGLDPEFLAALPPEIQEELMQQQQAERRRRQRQRQAAAAAVTAAGAAGVAPAAAGPAEIDLATLLATFPPDVREEVLLTSDESILRTLPPALLAEANALRSRYRSAFRQQLHESGAAAAAAAATAAEAAGTTGTAAGQRRQRPSSIFDVDFHRDAYPGLGLRRDNVSREGFMDAAFAQLMRNRPPRQAQTGGMLAGHTSMRAGALVGCAAEDAAIARENPPLLEDQDLMALTQLMRLSHEICRSQSFMKVLINICSHTRSRRCLVRLLMALIRSSWQSHLEEMDAKKHSSLVEGEAPSNPQQGSDHVHSDLAVPAGTAGTALMPSGSPLSNSEAIGAMQLDSNSGSSSSNGVSNINLYRSALTTLSFLARQCGPVARMLVLLKVPDSLEQAVEGRPSDSKGKGQSVAQRGADESRQPSALEVLLQCFSDIFHKAADSSLQSQRRNRYTMVLEGTLPVLESVLRVTVLQIESLKASAADAENAVKEAEEAKKQEEQAKDVAAAICVAAANPADQAEEAGAAAATLADQAEEAGANDAVMTEAATPAAVNNTSVSDDVVPLAASSELLSSTVPSGSTDAGPEPVTAAAPPTSASTLTQQAPHAGSCAGQGASAGPSSSRAGTIPATEAAGPSSSRAGTIPATEAAAAAAPFIAGIQEITNMLSCLPESLVRHLAGVLGQSALSLTDSSYTRASNALKCLIQASPSHLPLLMEELSCCLIRLAGETSEHLSNASNDNIDSSSAPMLAVSSLGSRVLRVLNLLQGLSKPGSKVTTTSSSGQGQGFLEQQQVMHRNEAFRALQADVQSVGNQSIQDVMRTLTAFRQLSRDGLESSDAPAAAAAAAAATSSHDATAAVGSAGTEMVASASSVVRMAVKALLAELLPNLKHLWQQLSTCIGEIEKQMASPGAGGSTSSAAASAAGSSKVLPAGASQLLPLVEAFFITCALDEALPPPPGVTDDSTLVTVTSALTPLPSLLSAEGPAAASTSRGSEAPGQVAAAAAAAAATGSLRQVHAAEVAGASTSSANLTPTPSLLSSSSLMPAALQEEKHSDFIRFVESHTRLLNAYIRRTPALLEGSLAPLMNVHKLIDFDNKRLWFRSKVRRQEAERPYGTLRISVRRDHVFEDTFHQLRSRTPEEMRMKLNVQFTGEEGVDAGGVSREWYQVMAREIFDPNLALFIPVPEGGTTFQPNPNSVIQSDRGINHLDYFKFVGRIVGKALHDGQLIDAYFTRSFYKHMLGTSLTYEDIEAVDPEYYKNLIWMLSNDITEVLDLTFTAESDFFGRKELVELVPGGKDLRVTETNKREYVNLIARHRMTTSIKAQIGAFLEGFWQLVPRTHITIFNDHELELLISGLPEVDIADLRANTEYTGFSSTAPVIRWFWEVVNEMTAEDKALLLQFVTGTSKVPLDGFRALQGIGGPQKFQIHKAYGPTDRLPSAHTCFNQLDIPEYESKEQLVSKLMVALKQGATGFGFA